MIFYKQKNHRLNKPYIWCIACSYGGLDSDYDMFLNSTIHECIKCKRKFTKDDVIMWDTNWKENYV